MEETQNWVAMGYIKGAFGVKGWVKIQTSTEYTDSLLDYPTWYLNKNAQRIHVEIEDAKIVGDELQVKFNHIHDRDAAALLRGYTIEVPRSDFNPTEEDEFYWVDLINMQVQNRNKEILGTVTKLIETGAHDVLVVQNESQERLIPFVSHYIDEVDMQNRIITADWGLDY